MRIHRRRHGVHSRGIPGWLVPLLAWVVLAGAPALADAGGPDDGDDGGLIFVQICHFPPGQPDRARTIRVSIAALEAHLVEHGDFIGDCDEPGDGGDAAGDQGAN